MKYTDKEEEISLKVEKIDIRNEEVLLVFERFKRTGKIET